MNTLKGSIKLLGIASMLFSATLVGCKKPNTLDTDESPVTVTITVSQPTVLANATLISAEGTLTRGDRTVECTANQNVLTATVTPGLWTAKISAKYREPGRRSPVVTEYTGQINAEHGAKANDFTVASEYTPSNFRDEFVIAEIFATGTTKPDGKQYNDDKYIVIANASANTTLYLDGYVLLQSNFLSSMKLDCTPAVPMEQGMVVKTIYQFPGSGTEYPVKPGEQVVICQSAIDHREANPLSCDLSTAQFEWVENSNAVAQKITFPNNPKVPNMKPIFVKQMKGQSGQTWWLVNNQESETFAIGKFQDVTPEAYVGNKANEFSYTYQVLGKTMNADLPQPLLFPNVWIEDAVALGIAGHTEWSVVSGLLDLGFTSASATKSDKNRYFKSVQRKKNSDGSWMDTNNSTNDFEVKRASLLRQ